MRVVTLVSRHFSEFEVVSCGLFGGFMRVSDRFRGVSGGFMKFQGISVDFRRV